MPNVSLRPVGQILDLLRAVPEGFGDVLPNTGVHGGIEAHAHPLGWSTDEDAEAMSVPLVEVIVHYRLCHLYPDKVYPLDAVDAEHPYLVFVNDVGIEVKRAALEENGEVYFGWSLRMRSGMWTLHGRPVALAPGVLGPTLRDDLSSSSYNRATPCCQLLRHANAVG